MESLYKSKVIQLETGWGLWMYDARCRVFYEILRRFYYKLMSESIYEYENFVIQVELMELGKNYARILYEISQIIMVIVNCD